MIAPFAAPSLADAPRPDDGLPGRLLGSRVRAGDWMRWQRHAGHATGLTPLLFESTTLAIQAALEGLGTVICSPVFVQEELRAGRLRALSADSVMAGDCYWLILPPGRIGPALRIFADWLVHAAEAEAPAATPPARRRRG
jgi:LysR family glycine cleavage system transcriptional activator